MGDLPRSVAIARIFLGVVFIVFAMLLVVYVLPYAGLSTAYMICWEQRVFPFEVRWVPCETLPSSERVNYYVIYVVGISILISFIGGATLIWQVVKDRFGIEWNPWTAGP